MHETKLQLSPLAISIALALPLVAHAEDEQRLPSVTVTAEHRQEDLQKTPLAITAFDENTLRDQQIKNVRDLAGRVPNLSTPRQSISYSAQTYAIRGIGETDPIQESTVAVYVDDLYIPRAISSMLDFNDAERVEVLRGPQGTLYGRNSAAGAVRLITRDPDQKTRGFFELGAGTYDAQNARFLASGPLIDNTLYGSFSATRLTREGTVHNRTRHTDTNNIDVQSYRGKLRWAPVDSAWDVQLTLAAASDSGDATNYTPFDVANGHYDKFTTYSSMKPKNKLDTNSSMLRSIYTINDNLQFKSVTAWANFSQPVNNDNSGKANIGNANPIQYNLINYKQSYGSQEFQLNGDYDKFQYTLGAYIFKERFRAERDSLTYSVAQDRVSSNGQYSTNDTESYALYGQGTYKLTSKLSLTGGLRYTYEHKNFDYTNYAITTQQVKTGVNFATDTSRSWSSMSPKIGLEYAWSGQVTQYGYVAKGFKAGGFDNRAPTLAAANQGFDPENVTAYEMGFKTDFGRLRSNIAVFYNDYRDLQTNAWDPAISTNLRTNVGSAHTYGLELENTVLLTSDLQLTANLGYLNAKYDDFQNANGPGTNADGNRIMLAPRWNANMGVTWTVPVDLPGALVASTDYQYQASSYANAMNDDIYKIPAQGFWNANTSYTTGDGHWTTTLLVKNILNRAYPQNIAYSASSNISHYVLNDPRTLLVSVRYDF
ncbi:TonB-dependent receptor [Pseudomonas kitaguniensis]|uniref:TonB-dependent receptor n=1 Tax=Pseudomonas kitaguniensis TaxID=2607908 RepID=UPI003CFCA99A